MRRNKRINTTYVDVNVNDRNEDLRCRCFCCLHVFVNSTHIYYLLKCSKLLYTSLPQTCTAFCCKSYIHNTYYYSTLQYLQNVAKFYLMQKQNRLMICKKMDNFRLFPED